MSPNPVYSATSCEKNSQFIPVNVVMRTGVVNYITHRDQQYLGTLFNSMNTQKKGWSPAGLTVADFGFSFGLSVRTWGVSSTLFCTELGNVDADFGYTTIDVYIDQKYKRGSCQYNSILDHENMHLDVFQQTLEKFAPIIDAKLREVIDKTTPVLTGKKKLGLNILKSRIENTLKPLIKRINKVLKKRNGAIDTLANYRKEQKNCSSW